MSDSLTKGGAFDWALLPDEMSAALQFDTQTILEAEADIHASMVLIGQVLEQVYTGLPGHYSQWVESVLGWSVDKAGNLRNYAKKFGQLDPITAAKFHQGAVYKLAAPGVSDEARQWAIDHARGLHDGDKFTLELAQIARDPYVRKRYDDGELTISQASKLAITMVNRLGQDIYDLCVALRVSHSEVALYLQNAFIERESRTAWNELKADGFNFRWVAKNSRERIVPAGEMTPPELEDGYKAYRQWKAIELERAAQESAFATKYESRSTRPTLIEQSTDDPHVLAIRLPDSDVIPPGATIEIEVIYTFERKPLNNETPPD